MGYGMGADRSLDYMETYPELRPKVESGEIDFGFCKRFVDTYRNKYKMIPKLWRDLENTFRYVTKYGQPQSLRNLSMFRDGSTTVLRLPSGRCLFYPHAQVGAEGRLRFRWGDLWGGTLTENVVQALSRDILAEAILFIEAHGFRVGHHVYDSVVVSIPKERVAEAVACVNEALTRVPEWATGWPLGVETTVSERYE
jgi:DNA polymerase